MRALVLALLVAVPALAEVGGISAGPTCEPPPGASRDLPQLVPLGDRPAFPLCSHVDQLLLREVSFAKIFDAGDALFDAEFDEHDGVGANLSSDAAVSLRFSRVPRADLPGFSGRVTGPNGTSCVECHGFPLDDGAGPPALNAHRNPTLSSEPARWIQRNTPHLFGQAALQLLAEELTDELLAIKEGARQLAMRSAGPVLAPLRAKGLDFGLVRAQPGGHVLDVDSQYVDRDLVVRPFQWKGAVGFVRDFVRDASHQEIGMQGEELAGTGVDADGDGVANEFTVGDLTALTVYVAAQPPPQRASELARLALAPPLAARVKEAITRGEARFATVGCAECHVPVLRLSNPIFREPSQHPRFRDTTFPSGALPEALGLDPARPVAFDLRTDLEPGFTTDPATGEVLVALYSDLRRHDLGPELAEGIDETGSGASVFLTRPLWGAGVTAPYLHDGRAPSLTAAIRWHHGQADASRRAFEALSADERADVIEFLKDLVLFVPKGG